ncbi:DUF2520 domain-containing protein [Saccharopolyspora aridisoli]|uniref:DUF2520 domain-containing protein n=1 Tax=Saccharopolyspora aridisoli TaxID=2530385 RepID=A0A4R4V040_9PSEU|nr:DUF2520 domain-containing protein [Saccharopolyspora aridisoli]TDC92459.1 DUF2520 domain-containing protein [Saccharopolyspora aridisoli]
MSAEPTGPRLRVGVISAGRVGAVLGAALQRVGHEVVAVSAVSDASLRRAEELLPGVPVEPPDAVAGTAELLVLAIPDDAIPGMVQGLVTADALHGSQLVMHTSGSQGVTALEPAAAIGALPMAMHPAMTFTGRPEDVDRLSDACMVITADELTGWSVAESIAIELGMEPVRLPEEARPLYHAALTHGANHLITLVNECQQLLRDGGVEVPGRVMAPLLSASLDNALRLGDRAYTGPVVRGDSGTVRGHLRALSDADPDVVPGYRELARRTAVRAERSGLLRRDVAARVHEALDEEQA